MNRAIRAVSSNALVRMFECGKAKNFAGMQLLLPVDSRALVPVEVVGIDFGGYASDGIAVLVKPVGGHGSLSVSATSMIDDTEAARKLYTAKAAAAEYLRKATPRDSAGTKTWQNAIRLERQCMTDAQREAFDGLAFKWFAKDVAMVDGLKNIDGYRAKEIFVDAVAIRFSANEQELELEED